MLASGRNRSQLPLRFAWNSSFALSCCALALALNLASSNAEDLSKDKFLSEIEPILAESCYDCHGYGMAEGGVALDQFESSAAAKGDPEFWWRVLKMLQAELMPPPDAFSLDTTQREQLVDWIKSDVFLFVPGQPNPGRVTLRRLNRVEYRNTVRDLLGVDYDTETNFPPDDSGHGFDNLGEVLNMSPLHLEKYVQAAKTITEQAMPLSSDLEGQRNFFGATLPSSSEQQPEFLQTFFRSFATRAYRRPVDEETLQRLVDFTMLTHTEDNEPFESAIQQSIAGVLSSPRFLFKIEQLDTNDDEAFPYIDEFSLASRLSYFLWSTMPDEQLMRLAGVSQLRENLSQQIDRMLADSRGNQFVKQFAGQWLGSRDIKQVTLEIPDIIRRDLPPDANLAKLRREQVRLRTIQPDELTKEQRNELRKARKLYDQAMARNQEFDRGDFNALKSLMQEETEMHFQHVFQEDRPLLELIDCDYAFLNDKLAKHYGIAGVWGDKVRKVSLPADSPRGGILTQGTMLVTTSNPNRTSPVKRGLYVLENILGVPPAPPPPDIPDLPEVRFPKDADVPSLRQSLAKHREDPVCSSCHNRMDPIGLAFENFNALGAWREAEHGKTIDPSGELISGSSFAGVRDLKQILISQHERDFYRCLTEKMLTFAVGRGLEYHDVQSVDRIVEQLEAEDGKSSVLLRGIVLSAPFQRSRREQSNKHASAPTN